MSDAAFHERPGVAGCPGCLVSPATGPGAPERPLPADGRLVLSLPTIHCAACISAVEAALGQTPGVRSARVNLTQKRASVEAGSGVTPDQLIEVLGKAGFEAYELDPSALLATQTDRAGRELLMRLGVAGFAAMNVMLLSVAVWSGATEATRDLFHWLSAAITLPTVAFSAQPFFRNAWAALRVGRMNMDVPIALAILLAVVTSLYETSRSGEHAYFDAALTLTFFLLAGRYLDHRARAIARSAAEELAALEVPRATRLRDGLEEVVPLTDVTVGDLLLVKPGARMPVDGVITRGQSEIDRSLLTGESLPAFAGPGSAVSVGEVNLTGPLSVRATAVGRDSSLHALADLVAVAESGRANYSSLADKAAKLYAPGVHILAALSFLGWYLATRDLRTAVNIAAAVLIITCPCALGLAVPAVTTAASGRLFRSGLLIKSATALERLAEVDTVVFDKTGTLTTGVPTLDDAEDYSQETLALAAGLAGGSAHPLSRSLYSAAVRVGVAPASIDHLEEVSGYGVRGRWKGSDIFLGRADWFGMPPEATDGAVTWLKIGEAAPVAFRFTETLREGAREAVAAFQAQGLTVALLSGDGEGAVARIAASVGIDDWVARLDPRQKAAWIAERTAGGHAVLMVGDGLNDTGALAQAHVSISPASALDAARVASDMVLLGTDLAPLGEARLTALRAVKRIRENFRIATVYNVVAVPLAVAGLATPLIAALAMSLSSVTVSLNALRIGGKRR